MLVDHTQIQTGDSADIHEYDLCIIGGGACGITLAREFDGLNVKVALVESGGFEHSTETLALYDGDASGVREGYLTQTRQRFFGGTTNHWGNLCRPFDELDFKKRAWIPDSVGWPFGLRDLEPYYDRAAPIVQLTPFFTDGAPERDFLDPSCDLSALLFKIRRPPTRFGSLYRKQLTDSTNVSIFLNCNAVDLPLTGNKTAVQSLAILTNEGKHFRINAKRYVLATGGLENPRFLLNCNKDIETGLGNHSDLVGRYFMSHAPTGGLGAVNFSGPNTEQLVKRMTVRTTSRPEELEVSYVGIREAAQERLGLLNQGFAFWSTIEELPEDLQRFVDISKAFTLLQSEQGTTATFALTSVAEQSPNRSSRVKLGTEKDITGLRKMQFEFRTNALDRDSMKKSIEFLATELGRLHLGRVRFDFDDARTLPFNPDDHHMGTTRMHDDPTQGVVDTNCRVHHLNNLYVTGGSVFPSGGFANPTITMIAMALRLADHLRSSS
ncbi:MAG TPA: hypothetical protein DCR03_03090 [Gammaproteobacteria bacterium]|nr:hypothetical protein [Gammaproteobacteria bacterium]